MTEVPGNILDFLHANHVVGLATVLHGEPWAASCFYAFDAVSMSLLIMSDEDTLHGQAMLAHPAVAGTIAAQPGRVSEIRGIQLRAQVMLLSGEERELAFALYCNRHPVARLRPSALWRLSLQTLKYTDNALLFGRKTNWQRDEPAA